MDNTDWENLSFWQKFTDTNPSRPEKTWKNRFFWTWPIHVIKGGRISRDSPRFKLGKNDPRVTRKEIRYIDIKTRKYAGDTVYYVGGKFHTDGKSSEYYRVFWYGWNWGWK